MKISFLGAGSWGFCLTALLARKGYQVRSWTTKASLAKQLNETKRHPFFPEHRLEGDVLFSTDLSSVIHAGSDLLVEAVTAAGIRPVFEQIKSLGMPEGPIILTSKGIEQNSGLILPEVVIELLGAHFRHQIGFLSGPSFAAEVIRSLPTSVVGTGFSSQAIELVCETFGSQAFRVYPNADFYGVAYGGALKNVIAIACGIADGLALGASARAALITRGLHEVRKLAIARGCKQETLNGLSGMGDFVLTCNSMLSRNFRYGALLSQGHTPAQAEELIGMVVEGVYTAPAALQLGAFYGVPLPITEAVHAIISGHMQPHEAVFTLMQRTIKEENL